jgi:hypothetical protein
VLSPGKAWAEELKSIYPDNEEISEKGKIKKLSKDFFSIFLFSNDITIAHW